MEATAELVAAMPDTIRCNGAVVVRARDLEHGLAAQRRWLDRFYPGHSGYRCCRMIRLNSETDSGSPPDFW